MTAPLAYLMQERCGCGVVFTPAHGNQRHCSPKCRRAYADQRASERRQQRTFDFTPPRTRPTHCACGGRYALGADLKPSSRCMTCHPLSDVERGVETVRVRAATHRRGTFGQLVRERMRQEAA